MAKDLMTRTARGIFQPVSYAPSAWSWWQLGLLLLPSVLAGISGYLYNSVVGSVYAIALAAAITIAGLAVNALFRANREILALEAAPAPVLSFGSTSALNVPSDSGKYGSWAWGTLTNRKSSPTKGEVAKDAVLTLTYLSEDQTRVLRAPIQGRWRSAKPVVELSPYQTHPKETKIDIPPDGLPYEFDLAVKERGDTRVWAVTAEQLPIPLDEESFVVRVKVDGLNFAYVQARFHVHSQGASGGLAVQRIDQEA